MTERDLDSIQSREEFASWAPPTLRPVDPKDDVPMGDDAPVGKCEDAPCCGCCSSDGNWVQDRWNGPAVGWPGDGSGMDDLADYNQMEGYDY